MSKERNVYDKEFKLRAVRMSNEVANRTGLARELGIRPELLRRWRREFSREVPSHFPGHGNKSVTPEEAENARLRKQLADAEMELEILKKAIGIFSRRGGRSSGSL